MQTKPTFAAETSRISARIGELADAECAAAGLLRVTRAHVVALVWVGKEAHGGFNKSMRHKA